MQHSFFFFYFNVIYGQLFNKTQLDLKCTILQLQVDCQ